MEDSVRSVGRLVFWFRAGACERVGIWLRGLSSAPSWPIGHCAGAGADGDACVEEEDDEADLAVWSMGHFAAEVEADAPAAVCGTGHWPADDAFAGVGAEDVCPMVEVESKGVLQRSEPMFAPPGVDPSCSGQPRVDVDACARDRTSNQLGFSLSSRSAAQQTSSLAPASRLREVIECSQHDFLTNVSMPAAAIMSHEYSHAG